jgi:hypothetical protein
MDGREISEMRVLQSTLRNAISDLDQYDFPRNGRLCEDISSLGYSQNMAVDEVINPRTRGLKRELAARVCESCVEWLDCEIRVLGLLKIDPVDPLLMREKDRMPSDEGINRSLMRTRRQ